MKKRNQGQGLLEYVLLMALVGIVVVGGVALTGSSAGGAYDRVLGGLSDGESEPTPVTTASPENVRVLVVKDTGEPLAHVTVDAFDDSESLAGSSETDSTGLATVTDLTSSRFVFRATYVGQAYWSDTISVPEQRQVTITIAERQFNVHVMNAHGEPLNDVLVYVFNESGGYSGIKETTDQNGMATFTLPDGAYTFRADYHAQETWSDLVSTPENSSVDIRVPIAPFSVRVYRHDGQSVANVPVYAFNEAGNYTGISERTGNDGAAVLELPNGKYQFRVDYEGDEYWSGTITTPDTDATTVQVGGVDVTVHVTDASGNTIPNKAIYLYNADGEYLGKGRSTDQNGSVTFELKDGVYRFRTIDDGQDYWSDEISVPKTTSATIKITRGNLVVTVNDKKNHPMSGIAVYVFYYRRSGDSEYTGYSKYCDLNGQASFDLSDGDYSILAYDFSNGNYEWSKKIKIPAHKAITIRIK